MPKNKEKMSEALDSMPANRAKTVLYMGRAYGAPKVETMESGTSLESEIYKGMGSFPSFSQELV